MGDAREAPMENMEGGAGACAGGELSRACEQALAEAAMASRGEAGAESEQERKAREAKAKRAMWRAIAASDVEAAAKAAEECGFGAAQAESSSLRAELFSSWRDGDAPSAGAKRRMLDWIESMGALGGAKGAKRGAADEARAARVALAASWRSIRGKPMAVEALGAKLASWASEPKEAGGLSMEEAELAAFQGIPEDAAGRELFRSAPANADLLLALWRAAGKEPQGGSLKRLCEALFDSAAAAADRRVERPSGAREAIGAAKGPIGPPSAAMLMAMAIADGDLEALNALAGKAPTLPAALGPAAWGLIPRTYSSGRGEFPAREQGRPLPALLLAIACSPRSRACLAALEKVPAMVEAALLRPEPEALRRCGANELAGVAEKWPSLMERDGVGFNGAHAALRELEGPNAVDFAASLLRAPAAAWAFERSGAKASPIEELMARLDPEDGAQARAAIVEWETRQLAEAARGAKPSGKPKGI